MPEVKSITPEFFGEGKVWITASVTRPSVTHTTVCSDKGEWQCTCEGFRFHSHCWHTDTLKGLDEDEDFEVSM